MNDDPVRAEGGSAHERGIFDSGGRLVRSLWKLKKLPAGRREWGGDDMDDLDRPVAPVEYRWKVVSNRGESRNVGAVGNSNLPSNAAGHIPTAVHDVAVDAEGAIHTVNYRDEAGADFKKWDREGKPVYGGRYQMRHRNPNGALYACVIDDQYLDCAMEG